jgi:hypothetical protein
MAEQEKEYLGFNPSSGFPAGENLFYECEKCGDEVPTLPPHAVACSCRNLVVDSDAGRVSVKDETELKLFRRTAR